MKPRTAARYWQPVLLVIACLHGCAAPQPDLELQTLATAGSANFHSDFSVFMVPSKGADADAAFISQSRSNPSEMSRQLAQHFATAEAQAVKIVVGGPNSAKTTAVIVGAAEVLAGQTLGDLSVLFVGAAGDVATVRRAVESIGGKMQASMY